MRVRYGFLVNGYVVMPEHVHLLVTEPETTTLGKALQALKLSVAVQRPERPFRQRRYYDFNAFSDVKRIEKLRSMHRNRVARGLAQQPADWAWSSFRLWSSGVRGSVAVESLWTSSRRSVSSAVPAGEGAQG